MYEPNTFNSEYIEIINTTADSIQLGGMNIITGTETKVKLSNSYLKLAPNEYFVLADDSLLNLTGEAENGRRSEKTHS